MHCLITKVVPRFLLLGLIFSLFTPMAFFSIQVQISRSVVYSNYSVVVQVVPRPPVPLIQGGTNIFLNKGDDTLLISLDGRLSYDPDFPGDPLDFDWMCKPVSTISSSCFLQDPPTSSPVLAFSVGLLKPNFDQFRFTLNVRKGQREASSEMFLTLTPNVKR